MRLQPIVYTGSMERAVDWYRKVLDAQPSYSSDVWSTFQVGDSDLALHRVEELPPASRVAISLIATEDLEEVARRLESSGIEIERGIQEETFGRSIVLRDPDGSMIQVNEHS